MSPSEGCVLAGRLLALALFLAVAPSRAALYRGVVVDAVTGEPVEGAVVTVGDATVTADTGGAFAIAGEAEVLLLRAPGYARAAVAAPDPLAPPARIPLDPFRPKALYLSLYGVRDRELRDGALALLDATELNALVIDVKGDVGKLLHRTSVPLAREAGAETARPVESLAALVDDLHARGAYLIARIVVFKDQPLALARPDLAAKTAAGGLWRDRERLPWTDPFRAEVREYNSAIAVEAARAGFDEIQFDYVRFPDRVGLRYARPSTQQNRVGAISVFLDEARRKLVPYNVFLAADVFGYVCWNLDDTAIGQRIEDLAGPLDVVSPMLYPSSFQFGIPGYRNPMAHPYEIVYLSLARARERTSGSPLRFRPWLQAFKDYAFDRRSFDEDEMRAQIRAAERFGSNGWMLWNPHNRYSAAGLER
jgi:hypothetical protein